MSASPDSQPRLRIALVILHADPARGGAERYTVDLADALAARGHDVSLLAGVFRGAIGPAVRQVHLESRAATRLGRYRRFLRALREHLSEIRYDVVHAMLPVPRCDLYHPHAGLAAEAVRTGHEKRHNRLARGLSRLANRLNRKRRRFATVERRLLSAPRPPLVLCLSDYVKEALRRHYGRFLSDQHMARLFNAVDLDRFDPDRRPDARQTIRQRFFISPDEVVALLVAQDFRRKGLRQAIEALARLRAKVNDAQNRLVLLAVGRPRTDAYRRLAKRLGVADRILFVGPTDDPAAFYAAADLLLLPTRHDPCSLVVLEALAMGLPVITTRQNGASEIMTSGRHGFVLDSADDAKGLDQALLELLKEPLRGEMSRACLALRPLLAWSRHVEELERIYRRSCEARTARAGHRGSA